MLSFVLFSRICHILRLEAMQMFYLFKKIRCFFQDQGSRPLLFKPTATSSNMKSPISILTLLIAISAINSISSHPNFNPPQSAHVRNNLHQNDIQKPPRKLFGASRLRRAAQPPQYSNTPQSAPSFAWLPSANHPGASSQIQYPGNLVASSGAKQIEQTTISPQNGQGTVIDLGSDQFYSAPCATMLSTSNCVVRVPDEGTHKDITERNLVVAVAVVNDQCSLTIRDCAGQDSMATQIYTPTGGKCSIATSVCCECDGCARNNLPFYMNSCAILFEHARCSMCSGFKLDVANGEAAHVMKDSYDNKLSSVFVVPGCELWVFTDPNYQGNATIAAGPVDELPEGWNDAVSSYYCTCPGNEATLAPHSTTVEIPKNSTTPAAPRYNITTTTAPDDYDDLDDVGPVIY